MAPDRYVVETGDPDLSRHGYACCVERLEDADGYRVARAEEFRNRYRELKASLIRDDEFFDG